MAIHKKQPEIRQQYGIRWQTGVVFAFRSRQEAEDALREDGRGVRVLVVHSYDATAHTSISDWQEVED
jgi:hypothetical protein